MKALCFETFGNTDVLQYKEIPDQSLIQMKFLSVRKQLA